MDNIHGDLSQALKDQRLDIEKLEHNQKKQFKTCMKEMSKGQKSSILNDVDQSMHEILQRKVDINDFEDQMCTKTSKKDYELSLQHISKLNSQLQSVIQ